MDYPRYFKEHCGPLEPQPSSEEPVLTKFEGIESVVFDIYGTLIISAAGDISLAGEASPDAAMEAVLNHLGREDGATETLAAYRRIVSGHQARLCEEGIVYPEVEIRDVWREVLAGLGVEKASKALCEEVAVIFECAANPVWPMPGLREVLKGLRERELSLGIVSNAQFYTRHMFPAFLGSTLEELGFADERMIFSYEMGEGKPSRRLYADLKSREVDPSKTLYVGNDRLKDIWPSAAEGFCTVLFAGDQRSLRWRHEDDRLVDCRPDAVITELTQIFSLLA